MRYVIRGSMAALVVAVALTVVTPERSSAESDLGQFCLSAVGFTDTIRLALTQPSGAGTIIGVNFRWRASTPYQVSGTGTITDSLLTPGSFDMALSGVHNTSFFGGNPICTFFAVLTPPSFDGSWLVTCVGGASPFSASGTLTFTSCNSGMSLEKGGPSIGG